MVAVKAALKSLRAIEEDTHKKTHTHKMEQILDETDFQEYMMDNYDYEYLNIDILIDEYSHNWEHFKDFIEKQMEDNDWCEAGALDYINDTYIKWCSIENLHYLSLPDFD